MITHDESSKSSIFSYLHLARTFRSSVGHVFRLFGPETYRSALKYEYNKIKFLAWMKKADSPIHFTKYNKHSPGRRPFSSPIVSKKGNAKVCATKWLYPRSSLAHCVHNDYFTEGLLFISVLSKALGSFTRRTKEDFCRV